MKKQTLVDNSVTNDDVVSEKEKGIKAINSINLDEI